MVNIYWHLDLAELEQAVGMEGTQTLHSCLRVVLPGIPVKGSNWAMIGWMRRSVKKEECQKKEKDHDAR